jgi:hypothetical protein
MPTEVSQRPQALVADIIRLLLYDYRDVLEQWLAEKIEASKTS